MSDRIKANEIDIFDGGEFVFGITTTTTIAMNKRQLCHAILVTDFLQFFLRSRSMQQKKGKVQIKVVFPIPRS